MTLHEWRGCTTESLRWADDDYHDTAGTIKLRPTVQANTTPHLFFVDVIVQNNEGVEVVLERIDGGKLLSCLMWAKDEQA